MALPYLLLTCRLDTLVMLLAKLPGACRLLLLVLPMPCLLYLQGIRQRRQAGTQMPEML